MGLDLFYYNSIQTHEKGTSSQSKQKTKTHCFLLKAKSKGTISHLEISETLTTSSNSLIVRHPSFGKFDQRLDSLDVRRVEDLTILRGSNLTWLFLELFNIGF